MPADPICVYCELPQSLHGESAAGPGWFDCPAPHDRAVSTSHFRPAGPTTTCARCGHKQPLPPEIARHLGGPIAAPFPEDADA